MSQIPEIPFVLAPQTDEAKSVIGFKMNDKMGKKSKLGGEPEWIQHDETPICVSCAEAMTFYGQLDCIGDNFSLGDCGMIYVFVCLKCLETKSFLQCY